jgi:hypothetical protein
MSKFNYTEKMLNELKSFDVITYDDAMQFAEKHNISVRSVVAKVRSMELPYQPKPTDSAAKQAKAKGESKADLVTEIQSLLNVNFKSLDKMVLEDLIKLRNVMKG